ncbi:hypothetical protein [Pseudonocardia adelaidensis]|uniref:Uncharacterized protein n=1 Tax=Pseudonocardia adelaidensis TaxID=648754 RepID=A0ABP9NK63_9PSEU
MTSRRRGREGGNVSAAKLGAVAALIGAVIGAVGAGLPAWLTTSAQITAEDARSNAEFVRDQRREAYAAVVTLNTRLLDSMNRLLIATLSRGDYNSQHADFEAAYLELETAASSVELFGSPEASTSVGEMVRRYSSVRRAIEDEQIRRQSGAAGSPADGPFPAVFSPEYEELTAQYDRFLTLARKDLGTEPRENP